SVPNPSSDVTTTQTFNPCSINCPHNGNSSPNGGYGNVNLSGNETATFVPVGTVAAHGADCMVGVYYVNSISLTGNSQIEVAPCPGTGIAGYPAVYAPVIINIVGQGQSTVLDLGGNGISNPSFNASLVQIQYNGTGAIDIHGNGASAGVVYAPNAAATLSGNGTIYGSVIARTLQANGN